ncbi:MAG: diphthine synthase [Candidatus Natronoplasma sp.]
MGELIFIGLGLYDDKDISVKGLQNARDADRVYSEFYTSSLFGASLEDIEDRLKKDVIGLSRDEVEKEAVPLEKAEKGKVAFLTGGDPMAATTHIDLRLRAEEKGIETKIIHSSSIFSAVPSQLGLQHYKFGRTVTLPFRDGKKEYPTSPYENIKENMDRGLHTLVLLDINSEDQRYMSVKEGVEALLHLEEELKEGVIAEDTLLAGLARVGSDDTKIKAGYLEELLDHDFGDGLHSIVVFGNLHFMEVESLENLADAPEEIKKER